MITILREYEENGFRVVEYTKDGVNVSHSVKMPISEATKPQPQPYAPTNTEIAQQIEDLRADLIIAGVIE